MTKHGHSFLKSIISSYELHTFFRYLFLKHEKLRQPVAQNILRQSLFANVFPSPTLRSMLMGVQFTRRPCSEQITDTQH